MTAKYTKIKFLFHFRLHNHSKYIQLFVCVVRGNYFKKIVLRRNNKKILTTQLIALERIIQGQLSEFNFFYVIFRVLF